MHCIACGESTEAVPCGHCGEDPRLDGRWQLLEVLGQGANGTTYRAVGPDGQVVAAKESTLKATDPLKVRELVAREARVLRQLEHDGVPSYVEEIWHQQGRTRSVFLLQEFVDGVDLATRLADHRYDEAEVLEVLDELAGVLGFLHRRSPPILHRDVKPSNVMRRRDGRHVLIDFGSVRDVMKDAQLGGSTVAGTFGYMAPEQFAGDASPRSDLYALGALGVALLTRQDPAQLQRHDRRVDWHRHASVSPGLTALLDRLLAPDPEARPADAEALRAELRALAAEEAPPQPPETLRPEAVHRPSPAPAVTFAERVDPVEPEPFHQPPARPVSGTVTGGPTGRPGLVGGLTATAAVVVGGVLVLALGGVGTLGSVRSPPAPVTPPPSPPVAPASEAVVRVELGPAPWPTLTAAELASVPEAPSCAITYLPDHEAHVGACPEALRAHVQGWVDLHTVDTRGGRVTTELAFVPRPEATWVLPHESRTVFDATEATYPTGDPGVVQRVNPARPAVLEGQPVARTVCMAEVDIGGDGRADAVGLSGCPAPFHAEAVKALEGWRWASGRPVHATFELVFPPSVVGSTRTFFGP